MGTQKRTEWKYLSDWSLSANKKELWKWRLKIRMVEM